MTEQCFKTYQEWVDKASYVLTAHPRFQGKRMRSRDQFRAVCFDSNGRLLECGADFMRARFPVYWLWPDQVGKVALGLEKGGTT